VKCCRFIRGEPRRNISPHTGSVEQKTHQPDARRPGTTVQSRVRTGVGSRSTGAFVAGCEYRC
jgi:hypothetical protein